MFAPRRSIFLRLRRSTEDPLEAGVMAGGRIVQLLNQKSIPAQDLKVGKVSGF